MRQQLRCCCAQYLENPPADENSNPKKDAKKDQGPAFKPANVYGRKLEPVSYMANPLPEHKVQPVCCVTCCRLMLQAMSMHLTAGSPCSWQHQCAYAWASELMRNVCG